MKLTLKKSAYKDIDFASKSKKSIYRYDMWRDGISQSMLQTRMDCTEKSRLGTALGWTPMGNSKPLVWGDLWHTAQSLYFKELKRGKSSSVKYYLSKVKQWIEETSFIWLDQQGTHVTTEQKDNCRTYLAEIEMLMPFYIQRWFRYDSIVKWLYVEDNFKVELGDGLPPLVGKFDRVYEKNKKIVLTETKTKGQWSSNLMDWLPLDIQLGTYLTALKLKLLQNADEVSYDIIRRPQERQKVNESQKDFLARIAARVTKEPDHYFSRYVVEFLPADIALHYKRTKELVSQYAQFHSGLKKEKRCLDYNSAMCEGRYGTCPFLAVCSKADYNGLYIRSTPSPELK